MKSKWHISCLIWNLCLFAWALATGFAEKSSTALLASGLCAIMAAYSGEMAWRELLDAVRGEPAPNHNIK